MERTVRSYEKVVAAGQLDKERRYWLNKFSGEWIKSSFPYDFKRKAGEHGRRLESVQFQWTGEIFAGLMKLRNESDRRLFVILAAGLAVLLHRYTSNEDIILGAPTLKQDIEAEFINTVLVLRNSFKQGMSFKQLLLQVRQVITEATENQNYPVEQLAEQLNITFSREDSFPLFDAALLVKNIHDKRYIEHMSPNILFSFSRTGESVEGAVEYNALLYTKETVEGIIRHFTFVLKEVLFNVDLELGAIDILSEEEKNRLLFHFNDTEREISAARTVRQLFEEQAGRTPDGIAVVCMSHAITYRELNHKSNRLAYLLWEKGVQPDTIVGIMVERSIEMIVGILGILKAGGAYLPIEPASPPEKITYILQDSNVGVLLSEVSELSSTAEGHLHLSPAPAASVAYVIYTSGTTGQPKGVLVEQRNAVNTLVCRKEEYQMTPGHVSLQLFSFAFDGFVTSLFTPLISGAKTILLSDEGVANMAEIKDAIFCHGVTHLIAVPSLFGVIIENLTEEEASSLRVVTLAGDKVPPAILETSKKKNPGIEIANEYGVTEAAVMSTIFRHQEGDRQIKIGYPIWNTGIYILDRFDRLQPVGVPGELCIAGAGVARGYLNKPELTNEKFFGGSRGAILQKSPPGRRRHYKTGDLARWLADGCIQLLGRMDYQVKIRGFRIELGEIESQLQRHDKIKQAVVMAREEAEGDNRLYAYFLTAETLNISEVREYLSVSLPDYMIPSYFVELEQMPLTPTGKIDRKKLLEQSRYLRAGSGYIPPRNETERRLVETWKSLLNLEQVGIQDNFFNIGGDSIKTISLLNMINREFDAALKAVDLYENETIEKIADKIDKSIGAAADDRVKQARRELEELKNRIIKDNRLSKDIEDIYPLSDMEKGMIFYSLRDPLNVVFHNQTVFQVRDKSFSEEILKRALMLLVEKHPILRSGYSMYDFEEPVHIVYKCEDIPIDIVHEDISYMERSAQGAYINGILKKDRENPFVFAGEKPLWRMRTAALDEEHICFIWICHHALLDGWSSASLMTELNNTYLALKEDESFVPRELKNSYKEFVIEHLDRERKREAVEYWKRELVDYKRFEFPQRKENPGGPSRTIRKGKNLGGQFLERIKKAVVEYDTSVKDLCFGAYISMLSMLSYDNDITAGLVNTNRPVCEDGDKILGCFLNTVPVRLIFPVKIKWKDVVKLVNEKLVELKNYDMLTLFEIVQVIGEQTKDENPIFDTIFNYMDFHVYDGLNRENMGGDAAGGGNAPIYVEDGGGTNTPFDLAVNTTLGNFSFSIYYLDSFVSDELVEKCCGWFEAILDKFIHEPEGLARKEALISREEKKALLDTFNDTTTEYPLEKPLHKLFEEQAERTPDHAAVVCVGARGTAPSPMGTVFITYRELNHKSNQLVQLLREKGVQPDTIVGIMLERSVEMIIGMLGILKAGGAYLPIDPDFPRERIDFMLKDSNTKVLLSEVSGLSKEPTHLTHITHPTHLCYIIYTSGTTGMPKGVMVEHRNVVNVLNWYGQVYRLQRGIHVMQATDYIFDPAVEQIFGTLIHGATLYMIDRKQRADIDKLRQYVEEHQVHIVNFVPAMLRELLVNKPRLKSLRVVISGGEKLDDSLKDQIIGKGYALYNHYGPTETTIEVLAGECNEGPVTLGKPVSNIRVYILDKNGHLQSAGIPGELCISGAGLARGYLNNPELTAEKFLFYISKKIYKTGDLARWLPDANIEFLGRIDHQVKIRGFRIELGEIEYQLLKHDKIKEAVVIELEDEDGGDNYLCAYFVCADETSLAAEELKGYLLVRLPGYMVPGHFVQMDRIPLTSTGKIDRKQLPRPAFSSGEEYTAPGNEVETKLVEIWEEVLGLKQDAHSLGIDDSFFALGGHSLKAILLVSKVHKAFNVKLPLEMLFRAPTVRQMARYIQEAKEDRYGSIEPGENKEYYALSSAQKRMYFLQQMKTDNTAYNMPLVLPLGKDIDKEKLESILRDLIARHESLRTSFVMVNKEPVQKIHDCVEFEIEFFDLAAKNAKERQEVESIIGHFVHVFDLSRAPLIRSGLMRMPDHNHVWLVDIHHIVSDGVSHNVLREDFVALYRGQRLGPLRLQYKDFSQWQNRLFARGEIKVQEDYWLELYTDAVEIPRLQLPVDFKHPELFTFEGANCGFALGKKEAVKFKALGSTYAATLYMNILAALNTLFYKYTGQRDIIIGTVIAGRPHVDLNRIIGMFVNTLPMRNSPEGEKTYGTFLKEVTANSLSAFENQGVQFEELVEKLQLERNTSRNPLFDVSMVVQDLGNIRAGEDENLYPMNEELAGASHKKKTAKFDMTFFVFENAEDIYIDIEYYTGIFKEETIRRMISHFKNVIKAVVENPSIKLKDIDILSVEERKQVLDAFNDTEKGYPRDKTIQQLFEEQAERTPDRVAVVGHECMDAWMHGGVHISYRELNKRSDQVARILKEKGVMGDDVVAIMIERSIEMIIGIIGILKSDGAYLPIEPDLPQERIDFMLKDSNARVLVSEVSEMSEMSEEVHTHLTHPTQLCYVIYTSGSTGKPRGVLTTHYNVIRVVRNTNYIHLTVQDRILQLSNYAFDGSVFDIYGALLNGAALILAPGDKAAAVDHLAEVIKKENITVFFVTTALFNLLVDEEPGIFANINKVLFGGERVSVEHTRRALDYSGKNKIIHVYGPTETTVYATYYFVNEVAEGISTVPIGTPLSNTTVYILDNYLNPVPIGVMGELYIGGYGTARGYLNNPELTAERFLSISYKSYRSYRSYRTYISKKIYKTGDLGRWLSDGSIEFLGRIDFQVKIRGFRIELGEIEYQLITHDEIKEAVVVDAAHGDEDAGDKYLCAYIVSDRGTEISGLNEYLSKYLPAYMIPSYFMQIEKIPLTANGKLDRKALPVPEVKADAAYAAPENEIERKLVEIWAEVLGIDKEAIGIHDNFFEKGGHSLKATIMVAVINKTFEVKVPLGEIFKGPTIHEIAELLMTQPGDKGTSTGADAVIEPVERKEYYPLSSAQKRLYFLQHMDPERTAYNMPLVLPMGRDIDKSKLESTIKELIARHESLRTSFIRVKDEPVQVVHDHVEFEVEFFDLAAKNAKEREEEENIIGYFVHSFDLSQAPLMRSGLIRLPDHNHIWMADIHHIVSDGTSNSILMEDFIALYNGHVLQPLKLHYKDFSGWQNHLFASGRIKVQEEYWLDLFSDAGDLPRMNIPADHERPKVFTFAGDVYEFPLNREDADRFKTLASNNNGTLYMNILTALNILFYKYTGQTDIIIGSGIAGRPHIDLQRIIGMFINILAMRNYPEGEKTYEFFLREVIANSVKAFENQDVQFEELVERLKLKRDPSRNPLFDISMVVQNLMSEKPGEGSSSEHLPHTQPGNRTSKFDMTFFIVEHAEDVFIGIEFYTGIFERETIQRLASHLKSAISAVIEEPSVKLKDIDIIPGEEMRQLLYEFNDTVNAYPIDKTIQGLFADQVERTPDSSALVYKNEILTYNRLNREADSLAHYLYHKKNVSREDRIGILMVHPLYCAITIIGILKAGGAYVPLGPTLPLERVKYMIKDACIGMVISERKYSSGLERLQGECDSLHSYLCMDTPYVDGSEALHLNVPSSSMAYIIYTSGTTGEPKGVEVEHRGVVNTLFYRKKEYEMAPGFVSLQLFSYGFDGFVTSFFTPLISGAKVVLLKKEEMGDVGKIREAVVKQGVTHFISVPPLYSAVVEFFTKQDFSTVKVVTLAGDKVVSSIVERTRVKSDTVEIVNEYGVTESSVMSTIYRHQEQDSVIKIGGPIGNTCLYILDAAQRPQPIGVFGELCISGEGLARGYLNNPELTAEKFILAHSSWLIADRREKKASSSVELPMSYELSAMSYFYKTGDLARWLPDGNIEFSDRMDQQVKLRGFRIELGEIESCLSKHEFIREAVVTAGEENGETYLCAYIVPTGEAVNMESVQVDLAGFLPDYMIPGYFVQVERVPLTPSGKVDRKKLPKPQIKTAETYTAPGNEIEKKLADIWSEVLGLGGHKPIGIDDNFFELGGHSLKATVLTAKIHKELDVNVPLAEIFTHQTIRELARYIERAAAETYTSIENAEEKEYYVLSSAQKRLYILQQFGPESTAYNIPAVIPMAGEVDIERLEKTFIRLITRHESLRTSFHMVGDEPVQRVHGDVEFGIEYYSLERRAESVELRAESAEVKDSLYALRSKLYADIIQSIVRPFDLSLSPLVRVGLIGISNQQHILMVDMHHIITDGTSRNILEKEFMTLYWRPDMELGVLRLQYKDFARWQNLDDQIEARKRQELYWLRVFFGDLPVLDLPIDFPRPLMQGFAGSTVNFVLSDTETRTLKDMAEETGATLYMSILSVFTVLLAKLSGQEDIVVGTPIAARRHADLEPIIGMFVNTLAMRNEPAADKRFNEFLSEVKNRALKAFENQEYQFEDLVEKVSVQRDTSRNPVFDVMFNLLNQADYTGHIPQMNEGHNYEHQESTSKFDLNLTAVDLGQRLLFSIEYSTRLFKADTINRIIGYFKQVLSVLSLPVNRLLPLWEIEIITGEEKAEILKIANGVEDIIDDTDQTIHRLFEKKVEETPDSTAVVSRRHAITYKELNDKANRLAYLLRQKGVGPGTIVGIKVERSFELIVGMIGILKAGGAYLPIDSDYPQERIDFMLADSNAGILLTRRELSDIHKGTACRGPTMLPATCNLHLSLAYVIYTSGSTGRPKGVMMEHGNLVNLIKYQYKYTNIDFTRVLQFASISFDVSFQEIFSTLIAGGTLFLTDNETRGDVPRLFKVIEENRIKTLFLPASYLKFILSEENYTGLMPGCVDHIVAAGEQLVVTEEFRKYLRLNRVYLHNHYGPSETHVVTALTLGPGEEIPGLPSIGRPVMNTGIYILDAGYHLQPVNVSGELYIGGSQVCRGYLNNPGLTAEKFFISSNRSYRSYRSYISKRIYKTGDLARWLPDTNLEFLGRIDQQVKVRGFRVEPGEIESLLMKYPDVKEAVVVARDDKKNDRYLCAYIVGAVEVSVLRKYLSQMLPDYMVPSYFVLLESIPLTPNKKVDRKRLPEPGITTGEAYAAPENEIEKKLVLIWADVLGTGEDVHIGIDDNFFESGGHSLKATILVSKIHKNLDVKVPLAKVFKSPTIRGLSEYIQKAQKTGYESIEPVEKKEYYSLSSAQKRMYFLQQLDVYSTGYNVPMILPLGKDIEIDEFASTIKKLIARHESLRTSFVIMNEEPVQRIHDHVEFEIEFFDLAAKNAKEREEEEKIIHQFVRVFDLSQAPLIRVGIFKLPEGYYLLVVDMHHIITDGISREVLKEDFINLTRGESLEPLRIQYKDFSQWQNHLIESGRIQEQEDYWLELYADAGEIPRLQLPADDKRPEFFTFSGAHYGFTLAGEDAAGFKALGSRYAATLYMNMLTALNTLFYKYTGQRDIVIGTGIGGRRHADLQRIIGMFVNTLVMRNYPRGEKTYGSFLEEVIANSVSAFENQDVQFEELVDKLDVERDTSRNPLFDISMVVQDFTPAVTGEELSPHEHKQVNETAKFDMTFYIMEYDEGVYIDIEYYTGIFKEETIRRLVLHLKNVIKTVASNPSVRLKDIDILSLEERRQVLDEFNDTERRYPGDKTIHELFNEQAERSCDGTAVVCMPHVITFRELDKKSNQAAFLLRKRGVRPDTIVGIMVEPSIEMVIGISGILKAGGAYLPIDPSYPQERIDYMLKDSGVKVLLTARELLDICRGTACRAPTDLAYVIYTSGTTGRPKGVAVEHRGAVNTLICRKEEYNMTLQDVSLQLFSYSFDGFVTSFFTPLLSGTRSVVMGDSGIKDIAAIRDVIVKEGVTHFISVPALYRAIIENLSPGEAGVLKVITLAGDRLSPGILELSKQKNSNLEIAHEYGVTEAAVMSTLYRHQEEDDMIKIGAPVWNTRIYIVNQDRGLQPVGAAGELCIAGDGLARGYLNNPELTADKFHPVFYRSYRSYRSYISKKIYKTGDLARWLPDGNIEFFGRIDQQVKVRGFRIELAEIEYRLMQHDKIKETVVMDRQDADGGDNYLCAYIVLFDEVESAELKEYLSANLPNYMIPAHFVPVESIPLTLHGKVDRKKLPGPEMQAVVKYTPPGNDVEKKLVDIWSEVIDVPQPIGIDDNFFELGGHSLKAAILTAKIHEKLGVNVPLAELFKRHTIRMLAEFLLESAAEDKKQASVDDRLVLLRKGTDEANNMFFIHAGSGDVEVYVEFCNHLHPGFNYWGIRISAGRWEDPAPQHWTIESLAREYVQTIKNLQPHAPYRLGGWSIGGTIAFEMVRQLEQMGEKIDFFAMIDSSAPNITLAKTAKGSPLGMVDRFEEKDMDIETIKNKVPGPIREAMPNIEQLDIGEIIYYWNVIRSLEYARNVYIPEGKISTAVHFFGAGYRGGIGKDKYSPVKQWNDYTTGVIKFYEVHGDHYSLFKTPHVVPFAEMFKKETGE